MATRSKFSTCRVCSCHWRYLRAGPGNGTCPSCLAKVVTSRALAAEQARDAFGAAYQRERVLAEEANAARVVSEKHAAVLSSALTAALDLVAALRITPNTGGAS